MTRVAISSAVLSWAMERSGAPETVKQRFPKLSEWLQGQSQPTLRQLEEFAKATYTPLGYLFLSAPPEEQLTIPHFRTISDEPFHRSSPDLIETVQTMEQRQAWIREYLIEMGQEPLTFVHSARLTDEPVKIAKGIRNVLGLTELWAAEQKTWTDALKMLLIMTDEAGILSAVNGIVGNNTHRKLNPVEFRGFVLIDEFAPLVFINGADGKAAQMFTLAHELAHVWLGSSAIFDLREMQPANDKTEQACNLIAAEFLVPEREIREIWPSVQHDPERFQKIARHFKVSEIVAARRALDLHHIPRSEFNDFYNKHMKQGRKAAGQQGGDFYANQKLRVGRRFGETVVRAAREGKLLYRDAYRLTGLYGNTFEQFAKSLGFGSLY
jgi:Zn-dependent peptidase ImmA (M78 family)/transcriptional regulator with XRE-family HTH domain